MDIVWFKRDLRIFDHKALEQAQGPILPLYILEPDLWAQPDMSRRHYDYLCDALADLNAYLTKLGQPLIIKVGHAPTILAELIREYPIKAVHSHQETWNGWTYERDKEVKRLLKSVDVPWHEHENFGIFRPLSSRDHWSRLWEAQMSEASIPAPKCLEPIDLQSDELIEAEVLNLHHDGLREREAANRKAAVATLKAFLHERGEHYTKGMSSPVTGFDCCSRLSAYLAFGLLSVREVVHACDKRTAQLRDMPVFARGKWLSAMKSFSGRLRWHCHFIQKLEDEPSLEFTNVHPMTQGLRDGPGNLAYLEAWKQGRTGYPFIDACMRCLIETGWMNFRMRAMLMSFATYHLWLDWRLPSLHLANLFLDYEPGIHYSQCQMQAGTTGINAIRIYNPIKQGIEQDPQGEFVKRWVPELSHVPVELIHTPWLEESMLKDYPEPIVDEATARKEASAKAYGLKKDPDFKTMAKKVYEKHGSRKRPSRRVKTKEDPTKPKRAVKKTPPDDGQLELGLDDDA